MRETEFYQNHVRKMGVKLHLERIESSVGTGFPDVCAAGGGKQFLIETKVSKLLDGKEFLFFEKFQLPFHQKRLRYTEGKGVFVMALCNSGGVIYTWSSQTVLQAPRDTYKKWTRVDVANIGQPISILRRPWTTKTMEVLAELLIEKS